VERSFGTGTAVAGLVLVVAALVLWRVRRHRSTDTTAEHP
jgi:hypothetical protein